ncbi:hypothetical protein KFL_014270010 [Klebsormidium nitens]|uniref:Uncharacterized protein n=1 Tax=Klebsormidium nitens TaxID=105231 RepID=A0A1Y1IR19_KLENI|nr:hypothetical protein KFL_014270010 [Klebsormidium nitens]|eukprot:GAQ93300.1 hypothetical protein KFL_014270010 [Klebsormidium nitens]
MTRSVNPEKFLCAPEIGLQIENLDLHIKAGSKQEHTLLLDMKDGGGWPNGVRGSSEIEPQHVLKRTAVALCGGIQPDIALSFLTNETNVAMGLSGRFEMTAPRRLHVESLSELRTETLPRRKAVNRGPEVPARQLVFSGTELRGMRAQDAEASGPPSSAENGSSERAPGQWYESEMLTWVQARQGLPESDSQPGGDEGGEELKRSLCALQPRSTLLMRGCCGGAVQQL